MESTIKLKSISDDELNNKLRSHHLWLCSSGECGQRADLTMCDLSGRDLTSVDLRKAICHMTNFDNCDLSYATFQESNLTCATFKNAILHSANFNKAKVAFSNFDSAVMDEYCLETLEVPKVEGGLYKMPGDYPKY